MLPKPGTALFRDQVSWVTADNTTASTVRYFLAPATQRNGGDPDGTAEGTTTTYTYTNGKDAFKGVYAS